MITKGLSKGFQRILWVKRSKPTTVHTHSKLHGMIFKKVTLNKELRFKNAVQK